MATGPVPREAKGRRRNPISGGWASGSSGNGSECVLDVKTGARFTSSRRPFLAGPSTEQSANTAVAAKQRLDGRVVLFDRVIKRR